MNAVWFGWLLRGVGAITALWGVGMLIANRSSRDPINPLALAVCALAGVLLLMVGYMWPKRLERSHGERPHE